MNEADHPATGAGPDGPSLPSAAPVLHLDGFDGPMDLLLDLVERQRIDLGRLSVQALAEQFVAALGRLVGTVALEQRAEWVSMATRLVLLRSRLLFASSPGEARDAEREAAMEVQHLQEAAAMRAAAAWLAKRPQLGIDVFGRPKAAPPKPEGGYVALMEACLAAFRGRAGRPGEEQQLYRPVIPDLWRVSDALARIRAELAVDPGGGELRHFLPAIQADDPHRPLKARAAVASTFAAALELAREGSAGMDQVEPLGPITLHATA